MDKKDMVLLASIKAFEMFFGSLKDQLVNGDAKTEDIIDVEVVKAKKRGSKK